MGSYTISTILFGLALAIALVLFAVSFKDYLHITESSVKIVEVSSDEEEEELTREAEEMKSNGENIDYEVEEEL